MHNTCHYTEHPLSKSKVWDADLSFNRACSKTGLGNFICPSSMFCDNLDKEFQILESTENTSDRGYINFGITHFDHLGGAILTVF